ncbi:gp9 [Clostridioides difficile]|nr:gp9 [Clostridioides difficile]
MARFVKKAIEVEAFRLGYDTLPKWFIENDRVCNFMEEKCINGHVSCDLKTLEGTMRANKGDYIIQGVKGEVYPCKADIFEMTYEKVEYTATIENLTNYAKNLEQGHRYIDKEKVKKNSLEFSAKLELDTTDFDKNIENATKEIETFNEAVYRLEENLNRVFGKEKLNEIKIKNPTKQLSDEDLEYIRETAYKDIKACFAKEGKIKINY